jgi:hypothetical protein
MHDDARQVCVQHCYHPDEEQFPAASVPQLAVQAAAINSRPSKHPECGRETYSDIQAQNTNGRFLFQPLIPSLPHPCAPPITAACQVDVQQTRLHSSSVVAAALAAAQPKHPPAGSKSPSQTSSLISVSRHGNSHSTKVRRTQFSRRLSAQLISAQALLQQ